MYPTGWVQGGAAVWTVIQVGAQTAEEGDDGQLGQYKAADWDSSGNRQQLIRESHVCSDAAITKWRAPKSHGGFLLKTYLNPNLGLFGSIKEYFPCSVPKNDIITWMHRHSERGA